MTGHRDKSRWITTTEAAKILGISAAMIIRLCEQSIIRWMTIPTSKHRRILRADVEKILLNKIKRASIDYAFILGDLKKVQEILTRWDFKCISYVNLINLGIDIATRHPRLLIVDSYYWHEVDYMQIKTVEPTMKIFVVGDFICGCDLYLGKPDEPEKVWEALCGYLH